MSEFIITEHAIIPQQFIVGVTTVRTTPEYYNLEKTVPSSEERYSIIGHSSSGEQTPLYVDLKHEDIPAKMKIVASQLSQMTKSPTLDKNILSSSGRNETSRTQGL